MFVEVEFAVTQWGQLIFFKEQLPLEEGPGGLRRTDVPLQERKRNEKKNSVVWDDWNMIGTAGCVG